jgi:Transposase IS116/IS110/IS902 family
MPLDASSGDQTRHRLSRAGNRRINRALHIMAVVVPHDGRRPKKASATDYERLSAEMAASIRLGYEVERDDPNFAFDTPPDREIEWLAVWLVSEGWTRPEDWFHRSSGTAG